MPGPKPKPSALRELEGNPSKRPLNRREPKPRRKRPKPPAHLSENALKEWRRLVRILEPMGVLTEAEADVLAVYVQTYDRWVIASRQMEKDGLIVLTEKGTPIRHPLLKVIDDSLKVMQRCMAELGMTPSARTRLVAPDTSADPFEEFLQGG